MLKIRKKAGAWGLVLAVLAILFGPAIVVAGAVYLYVSLFSVTITEGQKDIKPYVDQAGTTIWESESISLDAGLSWEDTIYVKNNGTATVSGSIRAEGNTSFGMVLFSPGTFTLAPGEVIPVKVTVVTVPSSPLGSYNFSVILYE